MDDSKTVESRMFGYLKRTVSILVESNKQADASTAKMFSRLSQDQVNADGVIEVDGLGLVEVVSRKRKYGFSSPNNIKRKRRENSSIVAGSSGSSGVGRKDLSISIDVNVNTEDNKENSFFCRSAMLDQLLWTLKYVKHNPIKINDEMLNTVVNLCEGMEKLVVMSRLNFTDMEFRRFLRISDTLFSLITSCGDDYSLMTMRRIYENVDNLFDNFLERFTEQGSNAEEQLKGYGFISTLIPQVKDFEILKRLVGMLLLRVYTTTTIIWKACVSCPHGMLQVVQSVEINLIYYYCQLLEVLANSVPVENRDQNQLKDLVHGNLNILKEDAGSLFTLLPNLAFILYSTILATSQNLKPKPSPLKEEK